MKSRGFSIHPRWKIQVLTPSLVDQAEALLSKEQGAEKNPERLHISYVHVISSGRSNPKFLDLCLV